MREWRNKTGREEKKNLVYIREQVITVDNPTSRDANSVAFSRTQALKEYIFFGVCV